MNSTNPESIQISSIEVSDKRRPLNTDAVNRLAASIKEIGLKTPITILDVSDGEKLELVAGHHRLAAVRQLGWSQIPALVIEGNRLEAEMWEIAENLHRAELTALERDEQIAKWLELSAARVSQLGTPSGGIQPNEKGVRKGAAEIGVSKNDASRAKQVSSLTDEAKQAAVDAGLDDNRTALLQASRQLPDKQVSAIHDFAERKRTGVERDVKERAANEVAEIIAEHVPADAWDILKANLYAAGANNIANALTNITGNSIMDKRGWK